MYHEHSVTTVTKQRDHFAADTFDNIIPFVLIAPGVFLFQQYFLDASTRINSAS